MKTKSRNLIVVFLMVFAFVCGVFAITPLTANEASNVRVDFCLTNGALENNVFFENDSSKYFISQQTKADGTLTSLEELYRTDNLDLEFDGGTPIKARKLRWKRSLRNIQFFTTVGKKLRLPTKT